MRKQSTLWLGIVLLALSPRTGQAIDFRYLKHQVSNLDGDLTDFFFKHEDHRIFYRLPRGWTWTDSSEEFVARPPLPSRGRLVLQAMPPFPNLPVPGNKDGIDTYRKHFADHLPHGATEITEETIEVDKLGGRELPATRATFSYLWNGRLRGYTVIYAQFRSDLWLVIRIDSLKEDFASVNAKAIASLEAFTEEAAPPPQT